MIKKWVLHARADREGEFMFCCSTQNNWCESLEQAREERKDQIRERQDCYEPRLSRKEALEELGGDIDIYEITLKKVAR